MKKAKYVLHKSKDGQFYFTLNAKNGRVLMTSETYKTKGGAFRGVDAVTYANFPAGMLVTEDRT